MSGSFLLGQDIPFTGLGQTRLERLFEHTTIQGATGISSAHNIVLDAYARDGVPGIFAFRGFVLITMYVVITRRAALAALPLVAFLVEGFAEVTPTHVPFFTFVFLAIACCLDPRRLCEDAAPPIGGGSRRRRRLRTPQCAVRTRKARRSPCNHNGATHSWSRMG